MKHAAAPTQPLFSVVFALFFAVALTLAGCSAGSLAGPDLAPAETTTVQQNSESYGQDAAHNEGDRSKNGSGTQTESNGDVHNN